MRRPAGATLFPYTTLFRSKPTGEKVAINIDAGTNPPSGVLVQYWLRDKAKAEATLAFLDRKSTRLNSSHGYISYAVFCLKKKIQRVQPRPAIEDADCLARL